MLRIPTTAIGVVVLSLMTGCTTIVNGKRSTNTADGIRYSLPAPHLVMVPQSDGTVSVEVRYLADPNNTYTLSMNSYMSKAKFDVTLADGMLTTVKLDAEDTTTANKALSTLTDLEKAKATKKEAALSAEKAKADAAKTEAKAVAATIQAKKDEIELLEVEQAVILANPDDYTKEQRTSLAIKIAKEKKKLEQLRANAGIANSADSFNNPFASTESSDIKNAYGPILFRVLPDGDGVKLVSVEEQRMFQTSISAIAAPAKEEIIFGPSPVIISASSTNKVATITSSLPILYEMKDSRLLSSALGVTKPIFAGETLPLSVGADRKTFTLALPSDLKAGIYTLELVYRLKPNEPRTTSTVNIHWLAK